MRWCALAWAAGLVCAASLMVVNAGEVVEKIGAAQAMYAGEEVVVGTVVAMRAPAGAVMHGGKLELPVTGEVGEATFGGGQFALLEGEFALRVDAVESKESKLRAGEVLVISYLGGRIGRLGDQMRAAVARKQGAKGDTWALAGEVEVLGRGEFVNPGQNPTLDLGSPEAKVLVKLLAPLQHECHQKTVELLKELAAREPERVRVQVFDMADREGMGRKEMLRERTMCATVLVNNRYEFTLGERKVVLSHKPNEPKSTYNSEDVIAVVEQEIKRLYGENAGKSTP